MHTSCSSPFASEATLKSVSSVLRRFEDGSSPSSSKLISVLRGRGERGEKETPTCEIHKQLHGIGLGNFNLNVIIAFTIIASSIIMLFMYMYIVQLII